MCHDILLVFQGPNQIQSCVFRWCPDWTKQVDNRVPVMVTVLSGGCTSTGTALAAPGRNGLNV